MAKKKNPLKNAKLVIRKSPKAVKLVLALAILLAVVALGALRMLHLGIIAEAEDLRKEAAGLEQENQDLQEKTGELGSVKSVEDIAREELGLVDPDTVVIDPQS